MAQIMQVQQYNNLMLLKKQYTMVMTRGDGSMIDEPRKYGWVVYGDNYAKWFSNRKEAELELAVRSI